MINLPAKAENFHDSLRWGWARYIYVCVCVHVRKYVNGCEYYFICIHVYILNHIYIAYIVKQIFLYMIDIYIINKYIRNMCIRCVYHELRMLQVSLTFLEFCADEAYHLTAKVHLLRSEPREATFFSKSAVERRHFYTWKNSSSSGSLHIWNQEIYIGTWYIRKWEQKVPNI